MWYVIVEEVDKVDVKSFLLIGVKWLKVCAVFWFVWGWGVELFGKFFEI